MHQMDWIWTAVSLPALTLRMLALKCWRDFYKRARRLQHLLRQPYNAFVAFLVITTLVTSWCVVLTYTFTQWEVAARIQRNNQLVKLLTAFPKQHGMNITQYQLNVRLSNMIPLDRVIPDTRPKGCAYLDYDSFNLPTVSIIIPFYNEAWSMMLRCLHSIVDKTPPNLIQEVILVDDNSDYNYLKEPLLEYVSILSPKIRIIRNREREGLIRARALAADEASGDVIIFLDAHVECNQGWLPPLLDVIKKDRKTIAIPHIDNIIPNTIEYKKWNGFAVGGFQWNMDYTWRLIPSSVIEKRHPWNNYATPTTIGCAMAVDRHYFYELGGFDGDMYIWGGENLEISFRTWMCGGSMVIVPCSRVGHVFRRWLPYSFPSKYGGRYVKFKNYQRVADAWMDEYSLYYYASIQGEVNYAAKDISSLKERLKIREKHRCKSFKWYMENVVGDMIVPDLQALFYGQLKVLGGNGCLSAELPKSGVNLHITYCGQESANQTFMYMRDSTITHQDRCLTATSQSDVTLATCATGRLDQKWRREDYHKTDVIFAVHPEAKNQYRQYSMVIEGFRFCLTHLNINNMEVAGLMPCGTDLELAAYQYWSFALSLDFKFARNVLDKRKKLF